MIHITQGQANTIILTLTEKSTLTAPVYLFRLNRDQGGTDYYFIAADASIYTDRYNQFQVTEKTTNPNPLNGEIALPIAGDYHYTIYEQSSPTNLNPALTANIVEIGRCVVHASASTTADAYEGTATNSIYNG